MPQSDGDLAVAGLTKEFVSDAGRLTILNGVDLRMRRGEALAVTGPSGSGKSTLLHILGMLDRPTGGTVRLLDEDPFSRSDAQLAGFRNAKIGFVFQDHHLLPQCDVLENVLIPALAGSGAGPAETQRAMQLLERVGLKSRVTHRPAQLSGGERQRVAVCRALINQPVLLLADEPTGNLDPANSESIMALLERINRTGTTVVMATHDKALVDRMRRRVIELDKGEMIRDQVRGVYGIDEGVAI
jgi:lipoprotein-releasing system ATP-binding protein